MSSSSDNSLASGLPTHKDTWPETAYKFVEFYKFEPQHLCKGRSTKEFYDRINKHEVPLNFVLNTTLYAFPDAWIARFLESFVTDDAHAGLRGMVPRFPHDTSLTQPDLVLESDSDRIFIECKIDAKTGLDQVQKYIALHAHYNSAEHQKTPWLLFLTRHSLSTHWATAGGLRLQSSSPFAKLRDALVLPEHLPEFLKRKSLQHLKSRYEQIAADLRLGHATWQQIGDRVNALSHEGENVEHLAPSIRFARGFVADLRKRHLWRD